MIVGIPVLFAHGEAMVEAFASSLPFPINDARRILDDIGEMTRGVFLSVGLTAAVQAALGLIGFLVLGVPHAGTLSALMFFLALVPGGVGLVWAPVAIWLGLGGNTWSAVFMVVWGGGVVGTIDNVLRPLLAGRGVNSTASRCSSGWLAGWPPSGSSGSSSAPSCCTRCASSWRSCGATCTRPSKPPNPRRQARYR